MIRSKIVGEKTRDYRRTVINDIGLYASAQPKPDDCTHAPPPPVVVYDAFLCHTLVYLYVDNDTLAGIIIFFNFFLY